MGFFIAIFVSLITLYSQVFASENKLTQLYLHSDDEADYQRIRAGQKQSTTTGTNLLAIADLDIDIVFELMPLRRSMGFMNRQQPICVVDKLKTPERESQFLFSLPVNIYLSRRLYQLADSEPLPGPEVYLPDVFALGSQRKLLLTNHISYGSVISAQLEQIPKQNKIYRNAAEYGKGLMAMFAKKRANYALFYPQQLTDSIPLPPIRSYPIKQTKPYVLGHIMCSNIEGMDQVVRQINNNLKNAYADGQLYQQHAQYLSPELIKEFDTYFEEVAEEFYQQP